MGKSDKRKPRPQKEKPDYTFPDEELKEEDLGSVERFLINSSKFVQDNRLKVFGGISIIFLILGGIVAFGEYSKYRSSLATLEVEKLEKKFEKNPSVEDNQKILEMESFLKEHTSKNTTLRINKQLMDLYVKKEDYKNAANYAEKIASMIDIPVEIKAYFYYLAANYSENSNEVDRSLSMYEKTSNLISSNKEMNTMNAWTNFHIGRLNYDLGKKEEALNRFKKVLEIEADYMGTSLKKAQQMSTYMILKINKG
jgi:tetratricopeptide (TPR) repeat protein